MIDKILPILLVIISSLAISADGTTEEQKPYFSLSLAGQQNLVKKAKKVNMGDSYQTVLSKLGKPDSDDILMRKQSNEIIGRSLKYKAVTWEKGLVNLLHDRHVSVYLDNANRVVEVNIKLDIDKK